MTRMSLPAALPAAIKAAGGHPGISLRRPPLWSTKLLSYHPGLKRDNLLIDKKHGLHMVMSQSACIGLDGVSSFGTLGVLDDSSKIEFGARFIANNIGSYVINRYYSQDSISISAYGDLMVSLNTVTRNFGAVELGKEYIVHAIYDRTSATITVNGSTSVFQQTGEIIRNGEGWTIGAITGGTNNIEGKLYDINVQGVHFPIAEVNGLYSFSTDFLNDGYYIVWSGDIEDKRRNPKLGPPTKLYCSA